MATAKNWERPRDKNGHFLPANGKKKASPAKAKPSSAKAKGKAKLKNKFLICLDSSGSMQAIRSETVKAFNSNVAAIRDGAVQSDQEATVGLVVFGAHGKDIDLRFLDAPVETLGPMEYKDYIPGGMTPLLDAVGVGVEGLKKLKDSLETSYVVMVVTDGDENASKKYDPHKPQKLAAFKKLLADVTATDRWTFAFSLPPGRKAEFCRKYGIPEGNVQEWEATSTGLANATQHTNSGVASYYAVRAAGQTSSKAFYTDLSNVKAGAVKQQLTDVRSLVKVWEVPKECPIRAFVEAKGEQYVKGKAYYQLTKPETIQAYKQIILIERGKQAVYAGADARHILGLPDGQSVRVHPGNHGNWLIFSQSTSVNRVLVRGTKLVYNVGF
jgi:hypothetical protein